MNNIQPTSFPSFVIYSEVSTESPDFVVISTTEPKSFHELLKESLKQAISTIQKSKRKSYEDAPLLFQ